VQRGPRLQSRLAITCRPRASLDIFARLGFFIAEGKKKNGENPNSHGPYGHDPHGQRHHCRHHCRQDRAMWRLFSAPPFAQSPSSLFMKSLFVTYTLLTQCSMALRDIVLFFWNFIQYNSSGPFFIPSILETKTSEEKRDYLPHAYFSTDKCKSVISVSTILLRGNTT
jgi:hypothetical protein